MEIDGTTWVVTGASAGIGEAIALEAIATDVVEGPNSLEDYDKLRE